MQYCEHIQSEVKKAKIRVAEKRIGETMTPDQVAEERELQKKQLEEIFRLMQEQNEKFGVNSVEDIQNQMKLYAWIQMNLLKWGCSDWLEYEIDLNLIFWLWYVIHYLITGTSWFSVVMILQCMRLWKYILYVRVTFTIITKCIN